MARTQAADYEKRRERIVEAAAGLFADKGFLGASIADIAEACDISKSLIYHYYASKEEILFDVMHSHVKALLDLAERIAAQRDTPEKKLRAMTREFIQLYVGAASRQRVLLNELENLTADQRKIVVGIQHNLIHIVEEIIAQLRPALSGRNPLATPAAMLYFGMINWMHTWLDASGRAKPARIAELTANIFLDGLVKGDVPS
ncbi:MAG: TetR/AcrR family transcriptional regulator [Rhizomicrobium sp.]|jgi:AcrR family transcriptional regulator